MELMESAGPFGIPLLVLAGLVLVLVVERTWHLATFRLPHAPLVEDFLVGARSGNLDEILDAAHHVPGPYGEGLTLLLDHRGQPSGLRHQMVGLWLEDLRRKLTRGLRLLQLVGIVSPLLGLLGTVIHLIDAFRDIATFEQPVDTILVTDGLWQALLTTALGLGICLPALVFAVLFRLWATQKADRLETILGHLDMALGMREAEEGRTPPTPSRGADS